MFSRTITLIAVMCLSMIITAAETSPKPKDNIQTQLQVTVRDSAQGLAFDLRPDGKVELTIKDGEEKTYKADSMTDFKSKYPDVANKYQIDRFIPRTFWTQPDS